jgi:hypothetical protein
VSRVARWQKNTTLDQTLRIYITTFALESVVGRIWEGIGGRHETLAFLEVLETVANQAGERTGSHLVELGVVLVLEAAVVQATEAGRSRRPRPTLVRSATVRTQLWASSRSAAAAAAAAAGIVET